MTNFEVVFIMKTEFGLELETCQDIAGFVLDNREEIISYFDWSSLPGDDIVTNLINLATFLEDFDSKYDNSYQTLDHNHSGFQFISCWTSNRALSISSTLASNELLDLYSEAMDSFHKDFRENESTYKQEFFVKFSNKMLKKRTIFLKKYEKSLEDADSSESSVPLNPPYNFFIEVKPKFEYTEDDKDYFCLEHSKFLSETRFRSDSRFQEIKTFIDTNSLFRSRGFFKDLLTTKLYGSTYVGFARNLDLAESIGFRIDLLYMFDLFLKEHYRLIYYLNSKIKDFIVVILEDIPSKKLSVTPPMGGVKVKFAYLRNKKSLAHLDVDSLSQSSLIDVNRTAKVFLSHINTFLESSFSCIVIERLFLLTGMMCLTNHDSFTIPSGLDHDLFKRVAAETACIFSLGSLYKVSPTETNLVYLKAHSRLIKSIEKEFIDNPPARTRLNASKYDQVLIEHNKMVEIHMRRALYSDDFCNQHLLVKMLSDFNSDNPKHVEALEELISFFKEVSPENEFLDPRAVLAARHQFKF